MKNIISNCILIIELLLFYSVKTFWVPVVHILLCLIEFLNHYMITSRLTASNHPKYVFGALCAFFGFSFNC